MDAIIGMAAPRPRTKTLFSWAVVAQRTMTICYELNGEGGRGGSKTMARYWYTVF